MKQIKKSALALLLLLIYTFFIFNSSALAFDGGQNASLQSKNSSDFEISSRIYEAIFGKEKSNGNEPLRVIVGGDAFGIKINEERPCVARADGSVKFQIGDKILKLGGKEIFSASDVQKVLENYHGGALEAEIERKGEVLKLSCTPTIEGEKASLGISLKQSTVGIGTITFIAPDTNVFGGLGHGVCDTDGELVSIKGGVATSVTLTGIKRGECGKPGELSGMLGNGILGPISTNTDCGVFGVIVSEPMSDEDAIPVGTRDCVTVGKAEIISTLRNGKKASYDIEITEIDYNSNGSKSFKIHVTDEALLAISGGIVRGMSGSPIIQDGKLVGAVTHVMVADPTEGYGIFIENMLNAANNQSQQKAA